MYYYYSLLILILIILIANINHKPKNQKGGSNILPSYSQLPMKTLDYNNSVFGKIMNFSLNNNESANLIINIKTKKEIKDAFYIDFYNDKIATDKMTNDNFLLRLNSNLMNSNNIITLNNLNKNSKSPNYINNLKLLNPNEYVNLNLKITPIKQIDLTDPHYIPLLFDSINIEISKTNSSPVVKHTIKKLSLGVSDPPPTPSTTSPTTQPTTTPTTPSAPPTPLPLKKKYPLMHGGYIFLLIMSINISLLLGYYT